MPENQRSRGGLLMRARLFTWLNAARDEAVKAGRRAPPSWPRSGPWRTNPTCARCSSNGWKPASPWCCRWCANATPRWPSCLDAGRPMRSGAYGIQEPAAGDELPPDVVLAPTLGFTRWRPRGLRRRLLRPHAGRADGGQPFTAIGIAWSCGELDADYEPAEHDYPLDAILTEDGWVPGRRCRNPARAARRCFPIGSAEPGPARPAPPHHFARTCTKTVRSVTSTVGRPAERGPAPP